MILIVDDDPSITASLALLLKQHGYRTEVAGTADEALARIRGERPRLVVQDMNFTRRTTGEEGLQLLSQIRDAIASGHSDDGVGLNRARRRRDETRRRRLHHEAVVERPRHPVDRNHPRPRRRENESSRIVNARRAR
jgi:CheY-like chemotaxis protein